MKNNHELDEVRDLIDLGSGDIGDDQMKPATSPIVPELAGLTNIEDDGDKSHDIHDGVKKTAVVSGLAYEIASNAEARANASALFASEFSRAAIAAESNLPIVVERDINSGSPAGLPIDTGSFPSRRTSVRAPFKPQDTPSESVGTVSPAPTPRRPVITLDAPDGEHSHESGIGHDDSPRVDESSSSDSSLPQSSEDSKTKDAKPTNGNDDFIAGTSREPEPLKSDGDGEGGASSNSDDEAIHIDPTKSAASISEAVVSPETKAAGWLADGAEKTAGEKADSDSIVPLPIDDAKSFAGNTASAAAEDLFGADEGDFDWLADDIKDFDDPVMGQQALAQDVGDHLDPDNLDVGISSEGIEEAALSFGTGGASDGVSDEYTDFGGIDPEGDLASSSHGGTDDFDDLSGSRPPSYGDGNDGAAFDDSQEDDGTALSAIKKGLNPNPVKSAPTKAKLGIAAIAAMSIGLAMFSGVGASVMGGIGASNNNAVRAAASFTGTCSSGNATGSGDAVNVSASGSVSQSSSSGDANERAKYIYSLLRGAGMSPHVAAGVLGNIQVETAGTFSPQIDNPNDVGQESFGIVQWRAGRRTAVESYMQSVGVNPNAPGFKQEIGGNFKPLDDQIKKALAAQVAYLVHENATGESGAWAKVSSMGSATDVADAFDQYWERSDGGARMQRKANANTLFSQFSSNEPSADPAAQKILEAQGGGGGNNATGNAGATSATADSGSTGCSTGGTSDGAATTAGNGTVAKAATGTCSVTTKAEPAKKEEASNNGHSSQQSGAGQQSGTNAGTNAGGASGNPGATADQPPANSGDGTTRNGRRGRYQDWDPSVVGASNLNTGIGDATACDDVYATTGSGSLSASQLNGVVKSALSVQGAPYVWGAAGPNSFDCSGLVVWAFAQNGLSAPGGRTADNQGDGSTTIATGPLTANLDKAQPGDLLFWDYENDGKWDHVGFYIGNGQMVHAPVPGSVVKVVPVYDAGAAMKIGRA